MKRTEKFIKLYTDARDAIIREIADERANGQPATYLNRKLRRIEAILQQLAKQAAKEAEAIAREAYIRKVLILGGLLGLTAMQVEQFVSGYKSAMMLRSLAQGIDALAFDKRRKAVEAVQAVGRRVEDVVQRINADAVRGLLEGAMTANEARARLAKELLETSGGLGGIRYRNGAIMPFEKYAAMVIRSTEREANNVASMQLSLYADSGLVRMSRHYPTCHLCAPRQGRIYRLTDFEDGDERNTFPMVSEAFPGWPEYQTVHPNCRHSVSPVAWGPLTSAQRNEYLEDAGKPFDKDVRSEAEIALYNREQTYNRNRNADWNQYLKYKSALGTDMPTFSGWRRMKSAGSARYRNLQEAYRNRQARP